MQDCHSHVLTVDQLMTQEQLEVYLDPSRRLIEETKYLQMFIIQNLFGTLPNEDFLIGDEAFSYTNQLITPYSGRNLHEKIHLTFIERSFSVLECMRNLYGLILNGSRLESCTVSKS